MKQRVKKNSLVFLLKKNKEFMYLEVKSVTLVENEIAKFPDAVTERGRSHVKHLGEMALDGIRTMVLFVVQRHDSIKFQPQWERDPNFSFELYKSFQNGTEVRAIHLKMTKSELKYLGELPTKLNPES